MNWSKTKEHFKCQDQGIWHTLHKRWTTSQYHAIFIYLDWKKKKNKSSPFPIQTWLYKSVSFPFFSQVLYKNNQENERNIIWQTDPVWVKPKDIGHLQPAKHEEGQCKSWHWAEGTQDKVMSMESVRRPAATASQKVLAKRHSLRVRGSQYKCFISHSHVWM